MNAGKFLQRVEVRNADRCDSIGWTPAPCGCCVMLVLARSSGEVAGWIQLSARSLPDLFQSATEAANSSRDDMAARFQAQQRGSH